MQKKKTDRSDSQKFDMKPAVTYVRRPSACSSISDGPSKSTVSQTNSNPHLGYNSEGRPKPPPPPRKTSLQESSAHEVFFVATNPAPSSESIKSTQDTKRYSREVDINRSNSNEYLRSSSDNEKYGSDEGLMAMLPPPNPRKESDSSSLSSNASSTRPNRPPPPRRTPSTSGPNNVRLKGTRDHMLYANLGKIFYLIS